MSIHKHPTEPSPPSLDEQEWQAQERALRDERDAAFSALRQALRQPPIPAIPMDFAARVARRADAAREAADSRFERVLLQVLIAVLGVSAGVISVLYGAQWLQAVSEFGAGGAGAWMALAVGCGGVHWMLERWLRQR